jgi:LysR family glycine cleavage system transcriptional activator
MVRNYLAERPRPQLMNKLAYRFDHRLPPLQTLQTFYAVASSSSFTAAATDLCLSQSAVSRQIQQLEHYFDCALFERHTRKVVITEQGMRLLPIIENLIISLRNAFEATRDQVRSLNVRIAPTLARRWLLPRLPALQQSHPDLAINIDTAWSSQPNFSLGDVDLLITYGNGNWPGMAVVPLLTEKLTPMCSPSLLEHGALSIEQLAGQVLLHSNPRHSDWALWLQAEGVYAPMPCQHRVFDTMDFALTAAAYGCGIVIGDINFAMEELNSGKLIRPFTRVIESGYGYYAIYPARQENSSRVADFIDWLRQNTISPL